MYSNILVPVVLTEGRDTQAAFLAAQALATDTPTFTVLHVTEDLPGYVITQIPDDVLQSERAEVERQLKEAAAALPGAKVAMGHGHAGRQIVDFARKNDVDCIVMASHQPGFQDLFIGSTADWVVRHAGCSVHVVR